MAESGPITDAKALPTKSDQTDSVSDHTAAPAKNGHAGDEIAKNGIIARIFSRVGNGAASQTPENPQSEARAHAPRARREMIERVMAFDGKRVFDVMLPRADIAAVDMTTSLPELIQIFSEAGHSRMPVYRGDLDDPVGMVHIKDLIGSIAKNGSSAKNNNQHPSLKELVRKVLYVPPSMRVVDLFLRMQASRIHMALVIDEYGGTDGLVTIEDLIEEIVGEINDEHDEVDGPMIKERRVGGWEADARTDLEELTATIGINLTDVEDDVDTLGGLIVTLAGRVPLRGEVITHASGLEFEIAEGDARRVRKVRIRPISASDLTKSTGSGTRVSANAAE